ncbi:MAG: hypothetical protein A2452_10055 [Candidatus Firestonebacteria bacterium RIFOXYC2_FULL_39_67]|nr:MAG: hypothetical protein A2536_10120 [Candidatus Firestonebacteria bacterium RIFOXYD2_FULL_39_29]OGF55238.1 MAG: hypothetical protein A2452_10055 [Candidatus Firestonebacteria bacterium RIFOXYC2_FULL_39_67]
MKLNILFILSSYVIPIAFIVAVLIFFFYISRKLVKVVFPVFSKETIKSFLKIDWFAVIVILIVIIMSLYYWNLPVNDGVAHWRTGKNGEIINSTILFFLIIISSIIQRRLPSAKMDDKEKKIMKVRDNIFFVICLIADYLMLNDAYLNNPSYFRNYGGLIGGMYCLVFGNYLPKIKNELRLFGVNKVKYTEEVIKKTNKVGGKIFFVFGLLCLMLSVPTFIIHRLPQWYIQIGLYFPLFFFIILFVIVPGLEKRYQDQIESKKPEI